MLLRHFSFFVFLKVSCAIFQFSQYLRFWLFFFCFVFLSQKLFGRQDLHIKSILKFSSHSTFQSFTQTTPTSALFLFLFGSIRQINCNEFTSHVALGFAFATETNHSNLNALQICNLIFTTKGGKVKHKVPSIHATIWTFKCFTQTFDSTRSAWSSIFKDLMKESLLKNQSSIARLKWKYSNKTKIAIQSNSILWILENHWRILTFPVDACVWFFLFQSNCLKVSLSFALRFSPQKTRKNPANKQKGWWNQNEISDPMDRKEREISATWNSDW